ncbi:MAG TPA: hypothetical protein VJQ79_11675 [Acidimicrobiia bacterium]|nr:hypothetical protein [Acidimicrobiia bacterium]
MTRLFAVAIRAGSAVLELEAPALTGQLPLADVGLEAFDLLEDALEAAGQGRSLPEGVDDWSREKIGAFLEELVDYQRVTIEYRRGAAVREVSVAPVSALDAFRPARGLPSGTSTELNGLLYEVNIKSGSFRLEDDLGRIHYLKFDTSGENLDRVRELIGRRVNAQGTMSLDAGRNERFEATKLSLAEPLPQHSFFDFDVDAVLRRTGPVVSVQSLAIEEFDEDEADGFWRAITD